MDQLTRLPQELLLQLSEYFFYDDLAALSLTCRPLNKAVYGRLQLHKSLKTQFHTIRDRSWGPANRPLGWFDVLAQLLRRSFPAEYVSTLRLTACPWFWRELQTFKNIHPESVRARSPWSEADMNLVVRAALSSPWIYRNGSSPCGGKSAARNMSEFVQECKEGDMDNILAILLPLLPNLERIELAPGVDDTVLEADQPSPRCNAYDFIPRSSFPLTLCIGLGSVPGVISRIASSLLDPSRKHELLRIQNPLPYVALRNLRTVCFDFSAIQDMPWAATLSELTPWMSLPSLRRIDAAYVQDHSFRWPSELPKSYVEDVRFCGPIGHRLCLDHVVDLAKGCHGPCLITQRDRDGCPWEPGEGPYDWQAVKVEDDGAILTLGGTL